ncbi:MULTISPECIES: hypothetical protein [unclassified Rathayibacter]|uniref:hypothetical protein n=1 Tax=unclassified Rathayibacter TaxID=2609250 RepID=UPI000F4B6B0F|nr:MULTISPECIES: hypothetical protein [unclassified Rathayibacter]ROP49814.1 D-mannose binding lectin [Rathayibacter sp. PhB186]ROS51692.1 D-mannose binding lectin [Rathayibacter sp. PhB185]
MTPSLSRPLASGLAALALTGGLLAGAAPAFAASAPPAMTTASEAAVYEPANLSPGSQLVKGQGLLSANGAVRFVLQDDGNAVVYNAGRATWSSGTQGRGERLVMQTDGNLVIYDAAGRPVWFTGTSDFGSTLWIQDDGNLVVYRYSGSPAWASSVNGRIAAPDDPILESGQTLFADQQLTAGPEMAVMQADGNFVLYGPQGARWSTGTSGVGNRLVMQTDGNAVVYGDGESVKWASGTAGNPGAELYLGGDGLVIDGPRGPVWTSLSQTRRDTLRDGSVLVSGDQLTSTSGAWRAVMQADGNFVVYGPRGADWSTGTSIRGSFLTLAGDGFLVMNAPGTQEGEGHWGNVPDVLFSTGPFRLVMQNDGNLVEYDATDRVIWASRR